MANPISSKGFRPVLALVLLMLLPSSGLLLRAQRLVFSGKGSFTDSPEIHPLSYWTENPLLRDDGGDLCIGCTVDGKKLTLADYKSAVEVTQLGVLAGHRIVQLMISIHGNAATSSIGSNFKWKVLLESVSANSYIEFYHLQPSGGVLRSAAVVAVGPESILASFDPDGGNGGGCWEGYWTFDAAGAHRLDFHLVEQAIAKVAPTSTNHVTGCYTLRLQDQLITTPVQENNASCHGCGWLGFVTAHFHLNSTEATPDSVVYTPVKAE